VLEASSGEAAIELARTHAGQIDVLFKDAVMPGISGLALAAALGERHPGMPVILTSGYTESEVARRGLAVTPDAFLHKPYAPHDLLAAVDRRT